jgi:hypothetical protein
MSKDDVILFEDRLAKVAVRLTTEACRTIRDHALAAGVRETGGILIGRYELDGNSAIVTEATIRPEDSRSGGTWFQRGVHGLRGHVEKPMEPRRVLRWGMALSPGRNS